MNRLANTLTHDFPQVQFAAGDSFYWSPETQTVYFVNNESSQVRDFQLFHETAHALLCHSKYESDIQLLKLEVSAWVEAIRISKLYGTVIDIKYVQKCLDTYRDWLYARSLCPFCSLTSTQKNPKQYVCMNCHHSWTVGLERFCRSYRQIK